MKKTSLSLANIIQTVTNELNLSKSEGIKAFYFGIQLATIVILNILNAVLP